MAADPDLAAHLRRLEGLLLDPGVRRSRARLEELLAPDLVEVGSSGRRWDREGIIAALADEERAAVRIEEFAVRLMGPAVALVTYRSLHESGACAPAIALRSSIWRRDDAGWRLAFHQGTRVP